MVFIKLRGWANYNVNHCVNILEYQILDIKMTGIIFIIKTWK